MSDEEYYQLQLQQWNKFFSCCLQYHQQDNTPVACFADNSTGMVTVIKKVCKWKEIWWRRILLLIFFNTIFILGYSSDELNAKQKYDKPF